MVSNAYPPLTIDGLSYSDWEDDADRLRKIAKGSGRVTRKHVERARELVDSLKAELDAVDSVLRTVTGFDAIRVDCVRDLIVALQASLVETHARLEARIARQRAGQRKRAVSA